MYINEKLIITSTVDYLYSIPNSMNRLYYGCQTFFIHKYCYIY